LSGSLFFYTEKTNGIIENKEIEQWADSDVCDMPSLGRLAEVSGSQQTKYRELSRFSWQK
jgi:hypothetical protein